MEHAAVEKAWEKMPFASSLSDKINTAWVDTICAVGQAVSVRAGKQFISLDDTDVDRGYVIVSGSFAVNKSNAPAMIREAPELIGEMSRFNPRHERTADVHAETELVAIFFSWDDVFAGLNQRLSEEEVKQLSAVFSQHAWEHFTES